MSWLSAAHSERSLAPSPQDAHNETDDHNDRPHPKHADLRKFEHLERDEGHHPCGFLDAQLDLSAFHLIELQREVLREYRIVCKMPFTVLHIQRGPGDIAHTVPRNHRYFGNDRRIRRPKMEFPAIWIDRNRIQHQVSL